MPLYKKKPFPLVEPPKDLDPKELVFQIRFTKEVFRDQEECMKRLNLYRLGVWQCKITGKSGLTYKEALASEHHASKNIKKFPKDSVVPVLNMIQYSTLNLKELANEIYEKLQKSPFPGLKLHGRKDGSIYLCRIMKVLDGGDTTLYEVAWLDKDDKVTDTTMVKYDDLIHESPISKRMLMPFIRKSTSQKGPWVVHEKLAKSHGISTVPPEELRNKIIVENGHAKIIKPNSTAVKKNNLDFLSSEGNRKRKGITEQSVEETKKEEEKPVEEPIRYPIDDHLVFPAPDDPVFTERPTPPSDFGVPMSCVGDLLMIWNFCCSFGKLLQLCPFTLEDFENAINHKDSNLVLIAEVHLVILRLLIKDEGDYLMALQKKRRKLKITLTNWAEFLCDFMVLQNREELSDHVSAIKRGYYGILDTEIKIHILSEMVLEALTTSAIREKLNDCIEQQQLLAAQKRMEARTRKEEKEHRREISGGNLLQNGGTNILRSCVHEVQNDDNIHSSEEKIMSSGEVLCDSANLKQSAKKMKIDDGNGSGSMKDHNAGKNINIGAQDRKVENKDHMQRDADMKLSLRIDFLGKDKDYNRYWFFPSEGRLFVQTWDAKQWGYYSTKDELDAFIGSLNPKGVRERALQKQIEDEYTRISTALEKRSKEAAQKIRLDDNVLRRSTRVRAHPRDSPVMAFLRYVNKWKE